MRRACRTSRSGGKTMKMFKRIFGVLGRVRLGAMTISRRVILTFLVLIGINVAVGALLWQATEEVENANREAIEVTHLMRAVAAFSSAFEAEQGTIRGYVISGEQR